MKRITIFLIAIFITGSLHAELILNGMTDMVLVPFQLIINDEVKPETSFFPGEEEIIMGAGVGRNVSSQGARARLDMRASYEDVIGMRTRIQVRTDGIGVEDYLQAWWKPLPWMRIDGGRFFDDRLRGKINDLDERMNAYTVRMYDADAIFTRFRTHWTGQSGIMISFIPQENFFAGVLLHSLNPLSSAGSAGTLYDAHPDYVTDNADVFHNIQAAAAYTIPDIGLVRMQYFGTKPRVELKRNTDEWLDDNNTTFHSYDFYTFAITAPRIEAAFALTKFSGLTLDIGGKLPIPFKNWDRGSDNIFEKTDETLLDPIYRFYKDGFIWQAPYQLSLGLKYRINDFEFAGRVDTKFLGYMKGHKTEMHFGPEINTHVWSSYDFSFAKLILNVGYEWIGASYDQNKELIGKGSPVALNGGHRLGTGFSFQKNIINGCFVKGGITFKFPETVNGIREKTVLTIPLHMEYVF
jgi:hypothetical protein